VSTEQEPGAGGETTPTGGAAPYDGDDRPLVAPRSDDADAPADTFPAESAEPAASESAPPLVEERPRRHAESPNMLPAREVRRSGVERLLVRLIATCGIVGIGVAIAAIMVSSKSQGWIVGLVVSIVSVILAALLWSSRML
jgi:hypothetical protein